MPSDTQTQTQNYDPNKWWETQGGTFQPGVEDVFMHPNAGGDVWRSSLDAVDPPAWSSFSDPQEFYDQYWNFSPDERYLLGEPSVTGETTDNESPFDFPPTELDVPPWLQGAYDQLSGFFKERMSPSFTMFSPEFRAGVDRKIGGTLALERQNIATSLGQRGIYGGGLAAQQRMAAAGRAGLAQADVASQYQQQDELSRRAAASSFANLAGGATAIRSPFEMLAAGMPGQAAQSVAPGVLAGPLTEQPAFMAWMGLSDENQKYLEEQALAAKEGKITPQEGLTNLMNLAGKLGPEGMGMAALAQFVFGLLEQ